MARGQQARRRQACLQVAANGPVDWPRRGPPRLTIIFRGTGKRILPEERQAWHPDVHVRFQSKAWADEAATLPMLERTPATQQCRRTRAMTSKQAFITGKRTLQSVHQLELATPSPQLLLSLPPSGWHGGSWTHFVLPRFGGQRRAQRLAYQCCSPRTLCNVPPAIVAHTSTLFF